MKTLSIEKNSGYDVAATFEIERSDLEPYIQKVSEALQKQRPIKGYRAGKAPIQVAKSVYGKELVSQAGQKAIPVFFEIMCRENNLAPITKPTFMISRMDENGAEITANFENYPEIESAEYKGLKVTKYVKTCSEADIDEAIDRYMKNHLWVHEVPREARMGDIVEVKFRGTSGGQRFSYDHSDKSRFIMGSGTLFAGLDEALEGHVAGDDLELSLTMPENFHREDVAGMTLDLNVHLVGVWARDLMECTDEYVRDNVKVGDCNSVAEFREKKKKMIQDRYNTKSDMLFKQSLDVAMANVLDIDVPLSMLNVSLDRFVQTLKATAAGQGMTVEQALEAEGSNMEKFLETCKPYAIEKVKISLLLDYVVRAENISVTSAELTRQIDIKSKETGRPLEEIKGNENLVEDIYEKLLNAKAEKIVRDNVVEVIQNVDEFPESVR